MKTRLRKLFGAVTGILMAVIVPAASMMAAAEGTSLRLAADKTAVRAGDTLKVSINVSGIPAKGWNILEFELGYDDSQLQLGRGAYAYEYGEALNVGSQMSEINTAKNPILGAIIDSHDPTNPNDQGYGQTEDGRVLIFNFTVKDNVKKGQIITLQLKLKEFATSNIVDGQVLPPTELVSPGNFTVRVTVI